MTPDELMRTEAKLRSIARELSGLPLQGYSIDQRSRASAMTCGSDRQRKCEANALAQLAEDLLGAVDDFNQRKAGV